MIVHNDLTPDNDAAIERRVAIFKALAHPTRCRIVEILAEDGEKCVSDLVERLEFDQSTISKHLSILRTVGVVEWRKDGLNVIYSLKAPCVYQFMRCIDNASCCPAATNLPELDLFQAVKCK
jgi:ArsR family transcriptional regulator